MGRCCAERHSEVNWWHEPWQSGFPDSRPVPDCDRVQKENRKRFYTNPFPTREEFDFDWFENFSIPQSAQFMIDCLPRIRGLIKDLPRGEAIEVLDVGAASGAGSHLLALLNRSNQFGPAMNVDALDILESFKPYAEEFFPDINYMVEDLYLVDPARTWDLVICSHTIEHLRDPRSFILELQRRARHWALIYAPFEEQHVDGVGHLFSVTLKFIESFHPKSVEVMKSPAWQKPGEPNCRTVLAVLEGTAERRSASDDSPGKDRAAKLLSAGYKAGIMCSAVFVAQRSPTDVLREELGGEDRLLVAPGDPVVDYTTRSVACSAGEGLPTRLAVFRDGYGTVLLPWKATLDDVGKLPSVKMPFPAGDPSKIVWPDGDLVTGTRLAPEVNREKLDRAVEAAFTAAKYRPSKTLGMVVVYKGHIAAERYAPGWGTHTQYRSWSSANSIASALVGIMAARGELDVSAPAPIPEWQRADDPRREITIENLLHMSSGLSSPGAERSRTYWEGADTGKLAARRPLEAAPGTRWKTSVYDTLLLMRSIKEVVGDQEKYLALPGRALLHKIGMRDTFPEIDPYGNFILSSQVYTTPRDLARLGLLYLYDGLWGGKRILPEGWVAFTRRPAPAKPMSVDEWGYGAQFWLIGYDRRVPTDTYTAAGWRGQFSTVVPSRDLVVVRMGLDPCEGSKWSQEECVRDVLEAIGSE